MVLSSMRMVKWAVPVNETCKSSTIQDMNYPVCANQPNFIHLRHRDIDEQAARLTGYEQQYQQLSRGRFKGSFLSCEVDHELGLYFESTNQVLYQSGVVPDGYYAIGLLMASNEPLVFNAESLPAGSAFLEPPNSGFEGTTTRGMNICVIHIAVDLLGKFCDQEYLQSPGLEPGYLPHKIIKDKKHTAAIYALVNDFLQGAKEGSLRLDCKKQRSIFKNALATAIEWVFIGRRDVDIDHLEPSRNKRRAVFHEARRLINSNLRNEISVQWICRELNVARRTLEYSFIETLKISPGRYIKLLRLNNIRREITSPENSSVSIGDLASRWGIWHLGRFAKDYQALFNELPSSTRKLFDLNYGTYTLDSASWPPTH